MAATITAAAAAGAAGASVEDFTRDDARPIHDIGLATERVAAAVEAARASGLVVTARAENLIHGVRDLDDTIRRLQAFQEAGADVLYAPGLFTIEDVRAVVTSVDRPVNVLLLGGGPDVPALAEAGVARVSVGGTLAWVAWGAVAAAASELLASGTQGYADLARAGGKAARAARPGAEPRSRTVHGQWPAVLPLARRRRTLGWSTVYSTMPMAIIPNGRYVGFSPDSTG